jgi:hypothetical protein
MSETDGVIPKFTYNETMEGRLILAAQDVREMCIIVGEMRRTLRLMRMAMIADAPSLLREQALEAYDKVMSKDQQRTWIERKI